MEFEDIDLFEELWRVFAFYTLRHDPLQADYLTANSFYTIAKDCKCLGKNVLKADCFVIFAAETGAQTPRRPYPMKNWQDKPLVNKADNASLQRWSTGKVRKTMVGARRATHHMDYDQFLNCLSRLAKKVYAGVDQEVAFERLLREKIIPYACRLKKDEFGMVTRDPAVIELLRAFEDPLHQIFCFYAITRGDLEVHGTIEFFRFIHDFNFCEDYISLVEIGEIYMICCNHVTNVTTHASFLTFTEFVEALVRVAVVTHMKHSNVAGVDMIKGMFHHMSDRMQRDRVSTIVENRRDVSTNGNFLVSGCAAFHAKFYQIWNADGRPNYLVRPKKRDESGRMLLSRIMRNNSSQDIGITEGDVYAYGSGEGGSAGGSEKFGGLDDIGAGEDARGVGSDIIDKYLNSASY